MVHQLHGLDYVNSMEKMVDGAWSSFFVISIETAVDGAHKIKGCKASCQIEEGEPCRQRELLLQEAQFSTLRTKNRQSPARHQRQC